MIGQGSAADQFYHPIHLDFDIQGNLYVSEGWNHRAQFLALIDNHPCFEPSTPLAAAGNFAVLFFSSSYSIFFYMFSQFVKTPVSQHVKFYTSSRT